MSMTEGYMSHVEEVVPHFMIHFQGAVYANELYCREFGDYVYGLAEAIAEAEAQFGPDGWEVYNGHEGENRFKEDS